MKCFELGVIDKIKSIHGALTRTGKMAVLIAILFVLGIGFSALNPVVTKTVSLPKVEQE